MDSPADHGEPYGRTILFLFCDSETYLGIIAMGITCVPDYPQTIEVCTTLAAVLKHQLLLKPLRYCILCYPPHKGYRLLGCLAGQSVAHSVSNSVSH